MKRPPWLRLSRPLTLAWHPGIRLRVSYEGGTLIDLDSDRLYYLASFGGKRTLCRPACGPRCSEHGWTNLLTTVDGVTVEAKALRLLDWPAEALPRQ